jgi:hypothetical protein
MIWKEYGNNYEVSDSGLVRRIGSEEYLKPQKRGNYSKVSLSEDNVIRQVSVHRLVAECFCYRANGFNVVDHIDRNPYNNEAKNLRWTTPVGNSRNGVRKNMELPDYVYKEKYKDKFLYSYKRFIDGKTVRLKSSLDLDKILMFKIKYEL